MNSTYQTYSTSTVEEFKHYFNKNKFEIAFLYLLYFASYGIWAAHDYVTFDAEGFYAVESGQSWYLGWLQLNRWFLVLMKHILNVQLINPYLSIAFLLLLMPMSATLWGYVIWRWNDYQETKFSLAIFGTIYLMHPIFAFQFAYRNQMEVIALMLTLMPVASMILSKYLNTSKITYLLISIILLVILFGTYQSFMFMAADAGMIYIFIYDTDNKRNNGSEFPMMLLKLILTLLVSFTLYELISKTVSNYYNIPKTSYFSNQVQWHNKTIQENIENIWNYFLTFAFHREVYRTGSITILNS